MKARIIRIGNSRGIRIPKPLLEEAGLQDEVEVRVQVNQLIVESARKPRAGWASAFKMMAARGDDALLDEGAQTLTSSPFRFRRRAL